MTPVKSSNIDAVGYDAAKRHLTVRFRNGSTYRYLGVAPETHRKLMTADSIGSHFSQHVRAKHKHQKVEA